MEFAGKIQAGGDARKREGGGDKHPRGKWEEHGESSRSRCVGAHRSPDLRELQH